MIKTEEKPKIVFPTKRKPKAKKSRKRLTRFGFEKLIKGEWVDVGRRRQNGSFFTWVYNEWKFVTDGKSTLRAKSWAEIGTALKLV